VPASRTPRPIRFHVFEEIGVGGVGGVSESVGVVSSALNVVVT
jgi:hypothetical protein